MMCTHTHTPHTHTVITLCPPTIAIHIHANVCVKCMHLHIHGVTGVKASRLPLMGCTGINPFCTTVPEGKRPRKEVQSVRITAAGETHCRDASLDLKSWYTEDSWQN